MPGIIRRERCPAVQPFSFARLEVRADELLAQARAESERIVSEAVTQAESRREEITTRAHSEGHAEGFAAGRAQAYIESLAEARRGAAEEIAALTGALRNALEQFEQARGGLLAQAESALLELSLAIARRVCKRLVAQSLEPARANVRAALELIRGVGDARVLLNPGEYDRLDAERDTLIAGIEGLERVVLEPSAEVTPGGAIVRAREAEVDARLEPQLDRIAAALLGGAGEFEAALHAPTDTDAAAPAKCAGQTGPDAQDDESAGEA